MRVLVTGASGTLAPFVIRALWERHEVVLLSRRPPHAEFAALPWIQGDITVFDDCWRAVQGMDAIQHLAAQPWPVDHPRLREQAAEDVARAHQLLMEGPTTLPLHDMYYVTADDTTALEPSAALIAQWQPTLLPYAARLHGHGSFFGVQKLAQAVGWQHQTSWRAQ